MGIILLTLHMLSAAESRVQIYQPAVILLLHQSCLQIQAMTNNGETKTQTTKISIYLVLQGLSQKLWFILYQSWWNDMNNSLYWHSVFQKSTTSPTKWVQLQVLRVPCVLLVIKISFCKAKNKLCMCAHTFMHACISYIDHYPELIEEYIHSHFNHVFFSFFDK